MTQKEKRGGNLRNEDVEKELHIKGKKEGRSYVGAQDTGDDTVRGYGTEVQRNDGRSPEDRRDEPPQGNRDPE